MLDHVQFDGFTGSRAEFVDAFDRKFREILMERLRMGNRRLAEVDVSDVWGALLIFFWRRYEPMPGDQWERVYAVASSVMWRMERKRYLMRARGMRRFIELLGDYDVWRRGSSAAAADVVDEVERACASAPRTVCGPCSGRSVEAETLGDLWQLSNRFDEWSTEMQAAIMGMRSRGGPQKRIESLRGLIVARVGGLVRGPSGKELTQRVQFMEGERMVRMRLRRGNRDGRRARLLTA